MKIFLSSYLNNNLGDDLMIKLVSDRYPHHDFFVCNTNCLEKFACENNNLHVIDSIVPCNNEIVKRMLNKLLSYLKIPKIQIIRRFKNSDFDVNLELGGSIFMQVTPKSWINKVRDARYIVNHCKYNMIIGSNFGPYSSNNFVKEHHRLFEKYDMVTFRDLKSYKVFSDLDNVKCYPDIVFNIPFVKKKCNQRILGISVISLDNKGIKNEKEKYVKGLIRLINELQSEYSIVLISCCEKEGDLDTCKIIIEEGNFTEDKVKIFNHCNVEESIDFFSHMSAMICTRFHTNIIAIALGIPFLPVIYSNKISNMLEDLQYSGYKWNIKDGVDLNTDLALKQLIIVPEINYARMEEAKGHLSAIDKILT